MCGIAGVVSFEGRPVRLRELRRMCAAIAHRGPNDEGVYLAPNAGLGMRRLSIIDLTSGRQPVHNEDGTVWAVFNGEIYNFQELRRDLQGRGHSFYTDTDTEVIVHLYEERGPRCVEDLRGMFAFAVWDEREQSLLLARDRVGIKPLYYCQTGGRLAFASEVKALLELPEVERALNWTALGHMFTFLTTPRSDSIVQGVRKLEPGTVLTASARGVRVSRYWELEWAPDYDRSEGDFVEELRERLEESVRLHLVSDVPLGAFLSGGIDSSSVVATMARLNPLPVKTFSIGFVEDDYNELAYARMVARTFGTEHHELVLEPDVLSVIEELAWYLDEPFGDPSAIPTYMVSKLAAQHVTVVLSGDGGDELFAGYDRYRVEARERWRERLPAARWACWPHTRLRASRAGIFCDTWPSMASTATSTPPPSSSARSSERCFRPTSLPWCRPVTPGARPPPTCATAETGSLPCSTWTSRRICPSTSSPRSTA
jgi:asparagine synthase (glutamine-hydrolysing)